METFDYQDQFDRVKKDIATAFKKAIDTKSPRTGLRLHAKKVWVQDDKSVTDWKGQHEAARKDKTWGVPVYADIELIDDKTGKVISTASKMRLALLPKSTNMGSFIVDGKHYQINNQLRRKPGIYVTEKLNHEFKAEILTPGRSFNIEVTTDKKTGAPRFYVVRDAGGGSGSVRAELYPLLSRLGVSDAMLAKVWGEKVLAANKAISAKASEAAIKRVANALRPGDYETAQEALEAIKEQLDGSELMPEVTKATVGSEHKKVTPLALLDASKHLLLASTGKRRPDERHALEFKKVLSLADVMRERFVKPNGTLTPPLEDVRRRLNIRLRNPLHRPKSVRDVLSPNQFANLVKSFFTQSTLSNNPGQTNPINMINGMAKVTVLGEGGISDPQRVGASERAVHPSQLGFIDPIHTPDSNKIGLVMNLPIGAGKDGDQLTTTVYDVKKKKVRRITPMEARNLVVAFPDQYRDRKPIGKKVKAIVNGEHQLVDPSEVDVVLSNPRQAFSVASNMIPFLASTQGVRGQMATKMLEQAIPLKEREAPLVQAKIGKTTVEEAIGLGFSIRSMVDGVVKSVTPSKIIVKSADGDVEYDLYKNLPLNNKSFLHANVLVKEGDKVRANDVLADSNFTRDGTLALGTNLRVAYLPWKGYNFEDGIVITESAAKKLTSEHLHERAMSIGRNTEISKKKYHVYKPTGLKPEQLVALDDDGVVKKGTVVEKGDPLWVGVREQKYDPDYRAGKRMTGIFSPIRGFEETWESDFPGKVVDVVKTGGAIKVYIKTEESARIGDKLTNRYGGKGIVTKIIPDGEAPHTKDGEPVEVILNPAGVVSRINPSQILETAAAKIADKERPYKVDNFSGEDHARTVKSLLAKNKVSDVEPLYDPHSKEPLGNVLVGPQYLLKLTKQVTSQYSAREEGKYDLNRQPAGRGEEGAKSLDLITMYSMLAHGARANLREMATYKAEQNDKFWYWLRGGGTKVGIQSLPPPEPTFAYRKFEAYMKGAGANITRRGSKLVLGPMTDKEVENLSSGEITKPVFTRGKDLKEEPGGLMDSMVLGGRMGERWGHIQLAEPIPNPVFEKAIRTLTNLNASQFDSIVRGELFVDPKTGELGENGVTGGEGIKTLLKRVNIDEEIAAWTEKAKSAKTPTALNTANTRLKYLAALKKLKVRPEEAYLQTKIPVIPPAFRPIAELEDGSLSTPGLNTLYRDVGLINNELKWQKDVPFITDAIKAEWRGDLYKSVKALAGFTSPIAYYPAKRRPKGIVEQLKGKPIKTGFFQDKLVKRRQNLVGRGTIIPEPKLGVDEVALPEGMAWTLYGPFVRRRLVTRFGMSPVAALEAVEKRTDLARKMLEEEMSGRPVMLNRAPSLHKFSIMAFKPQITDGKAIKIPPLVVKGFNADFDGDTMTVHVPILDDAVREAGKMLPSKNLYNPGTGALMLKPQNEALLGLYLLSKTPEGRKTIGKLLPPKARKKYASTVFTKSTLDDLLRDVAKEIPNDHGKVIDKLKALGDDHAYRVGFTVGVDDLIPQIPGKDKIFKKVLSEVSRLPTRTPKGKQKATSLVERANKELDQVVATSLDKQENNFHLMVRSGARGNMNQLKQVISAPFMVDNHRGEKSPIPITHSFAEGLPFSDYWSTLYGARASAVDKQLQTSEPGAFNKNIMASAITNVISDDDCMTTDGLEMPVTSRDVNDRFLAKDVRANGKTLARAGDEITPRLLTELKRLKVKTIVVRSPLYCKMPKGTCAKCYGLNEHGHLPAIGDNVGAVDGQSLSEPLTQMTMRTFHQGGLSGTRGAITGYEAIDKMFSLNKIERGKASLAPRSGKVTRIEDAPGGGGKNVYIGDAKKPVFIENDLWDSSRVRKGASVKKGEILSRGIVHPKELVELTGDLGRAQNLVADEIQRAYHGQGVPLKRRAIETVLRSVGNTTRVLDPGSSSFLPGDLAPWTVVQDFNRKTIGKVPVSSSEGHVLREPVPGLKPGDIIDERVKEILQKAGKSSVEVGPKPIRHKPELHGITRIPLLRSDWMSQMGYRDLASALVGGATKLEESDLHGYAPVPAFVYGAEFGAEGGTNVLGGTKPDSKSKTSGVY